MLLGWQRIAAIVYRPWPVTGLRRVVLKRKNNQFDGMPLQISEQGRAYGTGPEPKLKK